MLAVQRLALRAVAGAGTTDVGDLDHQPGHARAELALSSSNVAGVSSTMSCSQAAAIVSGRRALADQVRHGLEVHVVGLAAVLAAVVDAPMGLVAKSRALAMRSFMGGQGAFSVSPVRD